MILINPLNLHTDAISVINYDGEDDQEENETIGDIKVSEEVHTLIDDSLNEKQIIKKYIEKGTDEELWFYIDVPYEILDATQDLEGIDREVKIYELLTNFYIENEAWLSLNELLDHSNINLGLDREVLIDNKIKDEMKNKYEAVQKALNNSDKALIIQVKENYIGSNPLSGEDLKLDFSDKDEVINIINKDIKEIEGNSFYVQVFILFFLSVLIGTLTIIKFKKG